MSNDKCPHCGGDRWVTYQSLRYRQCARCKEKAALPEPKKARTRRAKASVDRPALSSKPYSVPQ